MLFERPYGLQRGTTIGAANIHLVSPLYETCRALDGGLEFRHEATRRNSRHYLTRRCIGWLFRCALNRMIPSPEPVAEQAVFAIQVPLQRRCLCELAKGVIVLSRISGCRPTSAISRDRSCARFSLRATRFAHKRKGSGGVPIAGAHASDQAAACEKPLRLGNAIKFVKLSDDWTTGHHAFQAE
jgi:hypothetical protein